MKTAFKFRYCAASEQHYTNSAKTYSYFLEPIKNTWDPINNDIKIYVNFIIVLILKAGDEVTAIIKATQIIVGA